MTRPRLTDADWRRVFDLRIRGKRGEHLSPQDLRLCECAMREDPKRYEEAGRLAFEETRPFGSTRRR